VGWGKGLRATRGAKENKTSNRNVTVWGGERRINKKVSSDAGS
jgi:hypothetical protein